jgi:DHA1 family bicyclomycin/chloramphenicol resistance-like MFS transporter
MFSLATGISIFSPSIEFFNVMRLFQGIGAAGGLVMSRSIATDSYSGRELAKTLAIIGAVNGVAPVTAPVIGGVVSSSVGWQGIFVILLIIGLGLIVMCTKFRETLGEEHRNRTGFKSVYAAFGKVLSIKQYVVYLLASGFANAMLFGYIASAPFVIQTHYGFSEFAFSLFFGLNSVSIGIGAALALKFKRIENAALFGAIGALVFSSLLFVGYLLFDNVYAYAVPMFLTLCSVGFVFTSTTTLAMDAGRAYTGAASAIFGAVAFFAGGVVSPIVGMGDLMHTMCVTLIVSAVMCVAMICVARKAL